MRIAGLAAAARGSPLAPMEIDTPPLGESDVLVEVSHCGLCRTDLHYIDDDFGLTRYPFVPGHEVVGTVTAIGPAVRDLKAGQRVGIGFQRGSCGHCGWCLRGEEDACAEALPAFVPSGGLAGAVVVDHRFAFPLPETMDSEHAAPLFCAGFAAYAPLRRHGVRGSDKVGVVGVGGVGHLAIQFARALGCEVTAFSSTPPKEPQARDFGAHHFVSSTDAQALEKAAASIDFMISTPHASLPWDALVGTLRRNGTLCLVGHTLEDVTLAAAPLIANRVSVCGSGSGGRAMMREMLEFAARAGIRPVVETMRMADANRAIARLREGRARYRTVLTRDSDGGGTQ